MTFDPATVRAYAQNADLADLLARMIEARRAGYNVGRCAGYWSAWYYPEGHALAGHRRRHGLEYLDNRLPKRAPGVVLEQSCRELCARVGRRHCEYLIAALGASQARSGGKKNAPARISWSHIRQRAAKVDIWKDTATRFWHHAPRMVMERSAADRAQVSDTDLLHAIRLSPFPKGRQHPAPAIRAQVRRICNALDIPASWLRQESARIYARDLGAVQMPPAALVGRVLGVQRAQAARLLREIGPLPAWYQSAFGSV